MRNQLLIGTLSLAALCGCGLESAFSNATHDEYDRPSSALVGSGPSGALAKQLTALLPDGKTSVVPFLVLQPGRGGGASGYELRLPSSKYSMLRADFRGGNLWLRAIVPSIGEESVATGVNLDARGMTEVLIVEARLSANRGKIGEPTSFTQLSPDVYAGTRLAIRAAFDQAGPAQDLLAMVTRVMTLFINDVGDADPVFFKLPALAQDYSVTTSPIDKDWLKVNPFDFGTGAGPEGKSTRFDALLSAAAAAYDPKGCIDPGHIRAVFTVDFNKTALDGNGGALDMFRWAKDRPGKQMYFASWIHAESAVQDNKVASMLGNGTPNVLKMYDDGTNGDEVAGDNIWTISFSLPYDDPRAPGKSPATVKNLRLGYKYTWGSQGSTWTGSEEWPGNSRILEIVDINGDGFVYRRDVFADEATNKDKSNFNTNGKGTCDWTTDFRHCGGTPVGSVPFFHSYEVYEQPFDQTAHSAKVCGSSWFVPTAVSPVRAACQ